MLWRISSISTSEVACVISARQREGMYEMGVVGGEVTYEVVYCMRVVSLFL